MTHRLKHILLSSLAAIAAFAATQAVAQGPTDAQRSAIKSNCRSDYMAHCSSVTPGGAEALQCLQKNMSSLSAACQSAVRAIAPPPAPKAETAPAPTADSKPAVTESSKPVAEPARPAAQAVAPAEAARPAAAKPAAAVAGGPAKPSEAQVSAIRGACQSDYPRICAGVPTGGAAALQCLQKNQAKLSTACEKAVAAASGGAAASGSAPGTATVAAPAAAAPPLVLRPLRPLEELRIVNAACGADARALCSSVQPGGGRIARCLAANAPSLSAPCKSMLVQFAAQ